MSLACKETEEDCTDKTRVYLVAHPVAGVVVPIGPTAISNIPMRETHADPLRRFGEGLNFYYLDGSTMKMDSKGRYAPVKPGKFAFAIKRDLAKKYLPKILAWIDKQAERRSDN